MTNYSFPSLGQTIRFVFDITGVLPRKRSESDGLSESDKKRLQKKLQRLASEEGKLEENAATAIAELSTILRESLQSEKILFVICETLKDLYKVYNAVIKSDGTYLTEHETVEWFCSSYAIPKLAFSVRKHLLRVNLAGEGLISPSGDDYYLPSINDGEIIWPLSKAMHWVYETVDTTQTRFHYPDLTVEVDHPEKASRLENAGEWTRGCNTPSWNRLRWNFARAFEDLAECDVEADKRDFPESFRNNIYCVLFIARLSTELCKNIEKAYGKAFLEQCIAQYRQHQQWLAEEVENNRIMVEYALQETKRSTIPDDIIWRQVSDSHWMLVADRMLACVISIQEIMKPNGETQHVKPVEAELIHKFGEYPVRYILSWFDYQNQKKIPDGFAEAFGRALQLMKSGVSERDIDEYEAQLKQHGLEQRLMWATPWLRAVIRYRNEDYEEALQFAERALFYAKYSAGVKQYNLVNLYVEIAAKNDDKKRFKKGVEWARFIGLEIRWLRDKESTEENLDFAYRMLKSVQYVQF